MRFPPGRSHRFVACLVALGCAGVSAAADRPVQDDIERNLQDRRARAFELQMDLEPGAAPAPLPETQVRRSVVVPAPGTGLVNDYDLLDVLPRVPPAGEPGTVQGPRDSVAVPALVDSQRRRQQGLQAQTRDMPEAQRRQALEAQRLQFERELQSERLRSEIIRNSDRALRR